MAIVKYPVGIQSFEEIRRDGWAYVDKTAYVYNLATTSKQVFLSRPRRFGKSLLLSTFKAYFEGKKELFEGLALGELEKDWKSYPVLQFSFGSIEADKPELIINSVHAMLRDFEEQFDVRINEDTQSIGTRFGQLIKNVSVKTGKPVVVLIDEYDKGIVELLHDEEKLNKNITLFRSFYSELKDQDQYLKFVFLTGVSRFRHLTLFSAPNQLRNISMNLRYAAICGLSPHELRTTFSEGIENLAKNENVTVEEMEEWLKLKYDGYRFTLKDIKIYNPFSILNCLNEERLSNYWLESGGSSKVFIDYLKNSDYDLEEIENVWMDEESLNGPYSTSNPIPLLFQTGYLTISDYDSGMYKLKIPNGEVRSALVNQLAPMYLNEKSENVKLLVYKIKQIVNKGDAEGLMTLFQQIISKFPHQTFRHNDVESVYHLAISLICQMAGVNARSEVSVAGGDIDMLIETRKFVYVIEFKKDHTPQEALVQIDTKAYALPWKADDRQVFKIGVEFSSANRNITGWLIC